MEVEKGGKRCRGRMTGRKGESNLKGGGGGGGGEGWWVSLRDPPARNPSCLGSPRVTLSLQDDLAGEGHLAEWKSSLPDPCGDEEINKR